MPTAILTGKLSWMSWSWGMNLPEIPSITSIRNRVSSTGNASWKPRTMISPTWATSNRGLSGRPWPMGMIR